jgi:hypothetical protein
MHIDDEAYAAGIVFMGRIVQPLTRRGTGVLLEWLHGLTSVYAV